MATHGAFTDGQARISARGGVPGGAGKEAQIIDTYTFTMAEGVRPTVANVTGLPEVGKDTSGVSGYVVESVAFRQDDARSLVWFADVTNGRKSSTTSTQSEEHQLINRSWGVRTIQRDMTVDANGCMVRNGAGDPFESVPQLSLVVPSITIKRKEKHSPAGRIAEYNGTVNDSEITIAGISIHPHCGRITITGEDGGDEKYPYEVTYQIDVQRNEVDSEETKLEYQTSGTDYHTAGTLVDLGFDVALLNCGYYYIEEDEKLRFYDGDTHGYRPDGTNVDDSKPSVDPGSLEQSTVPFALGVYGDDRREYGNDTYTLVFQSYPEADWSDLSLPND